MDLLIAALWDRVVLGDLFVEDEPLPELTGVMPETPDSAESSVEETVGETTEMSVEEPPVNQDSAPESTNIFKVYGITLGSVAVVVVFAGLILSHRRKGNL
jgi:hypothetical protein